MAGHGKNMARAWQEHGKSDPRRGCGRLWKVGMLNPVHGGYPPSLILGGNLQGLVMWHVVSAMSYAWIHYESDY
jgi:hypothetical protein